MFTETNRRSWGIVVVVVAAIVFVCIIVGALILAGTFSSNKITGGAATTTTAAPAGAIEISFYSSNTKEDWINAVTENFNNAQIKTKSGKPIFVRVTHVTSGGSQGDILSGKIKPVAWSPGDQSWVDGANQVWQDRTGRPLVSEACQPTVYAPIGFGMWRPMAEALGWPDKPISWDTIVTLAADPQGWASIGHPEWGQFKFGHTHPDYSNVGLLSMTALAYSTLGKTEGLTADEVYSNTVVEAFRGVEQNTYHYGIQSRPLMQILAQRGPTYLHAVTTSEAETLKTNAEFASTMRYPLVFIFPAKGTFWSEQPYCILDGDWVTDEQKEAARIFRDYLLAPEQQSLAIDNYVRPIDESISLRFPLTLENGTDPRVNRASVPSLESPTAEVAAAVKDVFHQTKKKATVVLVLDTSGSMQGEKIKGAAESSVNFIKRLDPDDEVYVLGFSNFAYSIGGGRAGDVGETLANSVGNIVADGSTSLYDAVCVAINKVAELRTEDETNGERRLYGIVLLSDGEDTASGLSENQMFDCLPTGEDVTGVKVFTIAYGEDANKDLMTRVANRTNGKSFTGDPESIESIYNSISAEQ